MEARYKSFRSGEPFDLEVELGKAKEAIYADPTYNTTHANEITRQLILLRVLAREYLKKYEPRDQKKKWVVVEEPFAVATKHLPIGESTHLTFRGKPDLVASESDGLWLYDHKTKGYVDIDEIRTWLPYDLQMNAYVWALEKKLSQKFVGFVYDVVKVPTLKQKWGESCEPYTARLEKEVAGDPALYFTRVRVRITPATRTQVNHEFDEVLQDYIEWNAHLRPTKNKQACFYYGKKCPFFEACFGGSFSQLYQGEVMEELSGGTRVTDRKIETKDKT